MGTGDPETRSHFMSDQFFHLIHRVLLPDGRVTILSDNRKYCRALAKTIVGLTNGGVRLFVSYDSTAAIGDADTKAEGTTELFDDICIHHGMPGSEYGHAVQIAPESLWLSERRS